jgi:hypothetical protein
MDFQQLISSESEVELKYFERGLLTAKLVWPSICCSSTGISGVVFCIANNKSHAFTEISITY